MTPYSSTLYKKDYSILISDAAGNPVSGATVTVNISPVNYRKGSYRWQSNLERLGTGSPTEGSWVFSTPVFTCPNEDANRNGVREAAEDVNGNGVLDPGVPIIVNVSGTTDAAGIANISLIYPKDRANWTDVGLTVRGAVSGTESMSRNVFTLPALADDFTKLMISPPGQPSPYGTRECTSAF
ncbi:hypothetical protein D3871_28975 [Noviherbaspirillum saxi]|uniref:Uncharacterized protein n=1 Tax=Noviherbaspirillum saxi TaxID=2320863 RepID=A0A3A3FGV5_9BURK|nr:hypothetical protein D3871_28975 [Noviherbaspirillum saxi]